MLSGTGDTPVTKSCYVPTLPSVSSSDRNVTLSDFVLSVDNDSSIEYDSMFLEGGTTEGSVVVCESKIPAELENGEAWQPSGEPWDSHFYLYHRSFLGPGVPAYNAGYGI